MAMTMNESRSLFCPKCGEPTIDPNTYVCRECQFYLDDLEYRKRGSDNMPDENAIQIDDDMPVGFDPDDLSDVMFEGLPAEYDPAHEIIEAEWSE